MNVPLTPPASRSRKENVDPSPSSPTPSRPCLVPFRPAPRRAVLFSTKNSHFAHTPPGPPRRLPSSAHISIPTRSILKRPSLLLPAASIQSSDSSSDSMDQAAPTERLPRHTTPEPQDDPLRHITLLVSPLRVLIASLDPAPGVTITLKDIIEAWTVIFMRLRSRFPNDVDEPEALKPFQNNLEPVLMALERDIRRALVNPVQRTAVLAPCDEHGRVKIILDEDDDSPLQPAKPIRGGLTEFEVTYARDLYMVCSAALKVVSLVFWVPQLYGMIEEKRLQELLATVLSILDAETLPTPNPRKTWTLASAVLQVQHLPETVVSPFAEQISAIICRGLRGDFGREGKKGAIWECLGALQTAADSAYASFRPYISSIFPFLLAILAAPSSIALKFKAALAFGSIAQLCVENDLPLLRKAVLQSNSALAQILEASFIAGGSEASWGVTVLGSVIIICGYRVLAHKKWLKTILSCMNTGLNAKKEPGVKLISRALWSMLVYAWEDGHRLGIEGYGVDDEYGTVMRQAKVGRDGKIASVAQAALLNHPVGVACVGACIGDGSDQASVGVGIQILYCMLTEKIQFEINIFFRLLGAFDTVSPESAANTGSEPFVWDYKKLACSSIINGSALYSMEADRKNYHATARNILANECVQVVDIRPLDAVEIRTHWPLLMQCWRQVLKEGIETKDLPTGKTIQALWSIFLTARKSIDATTEEKEELSAQIIEELTYFLSKHPSLWANSSVIGSRDQRYCRLAVPYSLFGTAIAIFEPGVLPPSFALSMLDAFIDMGRQEDLNESGTYALWRENITQVLQYALEDANSSVVDDILNGLVEENNTPVHQPPSMMVQSSGNDSSLARDRTWAAVWECATVACRNVDTQWDGVIALANCVSSGMNWTEIEGTWRSMARRVFELASSVGAPAQLVISKILPHLFPDGYGLEGTLTALALIYELLEEPPVVCGSDEAESDGELSSLFRLTSDILERHAPRRSSSQERPAQLGRCLDLIRNLEMFFRATPSSLLISRLLALQTGLLPWLHDTEEILSDIQYNEYIASLYSSILQGLCNIEATAENLHTLSPFLVSGFTHIPPPLACPTAFQQFWTLTYKPVFEALIANGFKYSDDLKVCLQYFIVTGNENESFAVGISPILETYSSQIPESQRDITLPENLRSSSAKHSPPVDSTTKVQRAVRAGHEDVQDTRVEMNSSLDSIPPAPVNSPTSLQVNACAPSTGVDVPPSQPLSEVDEEDLVEESLSLGEFVDGLAESETRPPPLEGGETGILSSSDVGDLDKARYIDASEVAAVIGDGSLVLPASSSGSHYPKNDRGSPSIIGASGPSPPSVSGSRADAEYQSPPMGHATRKHAGDPSASGPSTPTVSQPLSASPKKRARVWEADSAPHKRYRAALASESTDDQPPVAINLAASLVSGVHASTRASHHVPPTTTTTPQLTPPESPIGPTSLTASMNLLPLPAPVHRHVEVEVPTMHEIRALRSSTGPEAEEGKRLQKPPSSRPLKRMRSVTRVLHEDQHDSPLSDSTPAKRPRPLLSQRASQLRLQLLASIEKQSVQQDNLGSDDFIVDSPEQYVAETPESALRGPSLPGLGETVLSPALTKPAHEDNLGSDDSVPTHSSPIRGHVNRKLSRTTSSLTTESHRSGFHRSQSDELQDAVKLAVGNLDVIGSLDNEQLTKLREMLTILNGKVEDAISGK